MKKLNSLLKVAIFLVYLFGTSKVSISQTNPIQIDVDFLNQQMQILKLDTSKSNINRMEQSKQQRESTLGPVEKFVGESDFGFDTLKLAKLFVALYDNKYEEVIFITTRIHTSHIHEIKRLIFYGRVIANAHLNKPVECIDAYRNKFIQNSPQCKSAIQFHLVNNKIDLTQLEKQHDKITRRENLKGILIGGTGASIITAAALYTLYQIINALSKIN
jgi:hypothetical protein